MDKKTRLAKAFDLEQPDRPPILGGWLRVPDHIQTLTGCSEDDYYADPMYWTLRAERVLGSDGVVKLWEPPERNTYRNVDHQVLETRSAYTVERVLADIEGLPSPDELKAAFDEEQAYAEYAHEFIHMQEFCGDIAWCPVGWPVTPGPLWYGKYGYEAALMTLALHPDRHRKLIRFSAEISRQNAILRARAIRDGICPRALLTGPDLCSQLGPLVSPDYLRREYWPLVEYAHEPLHEVDAKLVWHCDGDVRAILDDILACGIGGLQGFQRECGMKLEELVERRTRDGDRLLIFGPLAVTTTLPHGTPGTIRDEVEWAMDVCRDRASLVFFTSNTIIPDTPLENIKAYWQAVTESAW